MMSSSFKHPLGGDTGGPGGKVKVEVGDSRTSSFWASIKAYMLCTTLVLFLSFTDGDDHEFCHALRTSRQGERAAAGIRLSTSRAGGVASALPLSHVAEVGGGGSRSRAGEGVVVSFGLVSSGIYAHLSEALLEVGVPVVLDFVVRPLSQVSRYG
ncbi:Myb-related protein Pp1 [Senna tora]|uniref:Myb-related protein Pp1 n=1 Tax=Senna tora TaxID=362788 RepID=A0A834U1R2_9FABA|nr:Myb-related protein Pp1 [Senna tora]